MLFLKTMTTLLIINAFFFGATIGAYNPNVPWINWLALGSVLLAPISAFSFCHYCMPNVPTNNRAEG